LLESKRRALSAQVYHRVVDLNGIGGLIPGVNENRLYCSIGCLLNPLGEDGGIVRHAAYGGREFRSDVEKPDGVHYR
jgi:hypothetical protein